ncbi:MAG: DUF1697 domain-containing protein [Patescibacteria group bacterium]|nr:DUF1697 domain-containing protein [Patescibacteria group bacterium]
MIKQVAFLRGINVGGHKPVQMEELKKAFESLGFENVKTFLASGNVLFETSQANERILAKKIEEKLKKTFGHKIDVLIHTIEELQRLDKLNPFKGITITPQTRLYVTFLSEKPKNNLKIPYESVNKNFKIIRATGSEVCSVLILQPNSQTIDLMDFLEKEFGRKITTRNWNTITRILKVSKKEVIK